MTYASEGARERALTRGDVYLRPWRSEAHAGAALPDAQRRAGKKPLTPLKTPAHQCTTNDVRRVPAEPHETVIAQRPEVVFVPTLHVQLTRPLEGRFA